VAELPEDAEGRHLLGTVLLKLNDLNGAIEELRRATRLDPYLSEARVKLAQALQKAGEKEEARKELTEVQRIDAEKAGVGRAMLLIEKAADHIKKSEPVKAIAELREAAAVSPKFPEAHYQLGLALRQSSDDVAGSEAAFRRVLELDPDHAVAHYQLGLLLQKRGDGAIASSELRKAAQLAPGLAEAHRELGRIAGDAEDWAAAVVELKALLAWEPGDADAHYRVGHALLRLRKFDEAVAELRSAVASKNGMAEAHYDLAVALKAGGELEEAAREFRVAQKLNPSLTIPR